MTYQDIAFLPSRASFYTTFHKNCDRGESLGITTSYKNEVEGKQGCAPCKLLLLHKASVLCQSIIPLIQR